MKRFVFVFPLLLFVIISKAQSLNDKLFNAVIDKDTLSIEKLLNKGADANYVKKQGQAEMSLLIFAVTKDDVKTVMLLLDHKANANQKDWFSSTSLMYAANKGNLEIIKCLLRHGADVNANDGQGNTVLSAAKEGNHPDVIKFIEDAMNAH